MSDSGILSHSICSVAILHFEGVDTNYEHQTLLSEAVYAAGRRSVAVRCLVIAPISY